MHRPLHKALASHRLRIRTGKEKGGVEPPFHSAVLDYSICTASVRQSHPFRQHELISFGVLLDMSNLCTISDVPNLSDKAWPARIVSNRNDDQIQVLK